MSECKVRDTGTHGQHENERHGEEERGRRRRRGVDFSAGFEALCSRVSWPDVPFRLVPPA
eukprot:2897033-Rhodomonas_salina.3